MLIQDFYPRLKNKKFIICDRDGTLNVDTGYPYQPEKLIIKEEIVSILSKFSSLIQVGIVSNQSGIGRGLFKVEDANLFNKKLVQILFKYGIF